MRRSVMCYSKILSIGNIMINGLEDGVINGVTRVTGCHRLLSDRPVRPSLVPSVLVIAVPKVLLFTKQLNKPWITYHHDQLHDICYIAKYLLHLDFNMSTCHTRIGDTANSPNDMAQVNRQYYTTLERSKLTFWLFMKSSIKIDLVRRVVGQTPVLFMVKIVNACIS